MTKLDRYLQTQGIGRIERSIQAVERFGKEQAVQEFRVIESAGDVTDSELQRLIAEKTQGSSPESSTVYNLLRVQYESRLSNVATSIKIKGLEAKFQRIFDVGIGVVLGLLIATIVALVSTLITQNTQSKTHGTNAEFTGSNARQ